MGEGRSGTVLQILMLLNFINIAKRLSFSASAKRVMYRQHAMVIRRNKSPVECSVVIVRCTLLQKHCFFDQKVNLPMGVLSLKFLNRTMRHN